MVPLMRFPRVLIIVQMPETRCRGFRASGSGTAVRQVQSYGSKARNPMPAPGSFAARVRHRALERAWNYEAALSDCRRCRGSLLDQQLRVRDPTGPNDPYHVRTGHETIQVYSLMSDVHVQ